MINKLKELIPPYDGFVDPFVGITASDLRAIIHQLEQAERMREALKPFSRHVGKDGDVISLIWGKDRWTHTLKSEDFSRARAALNQSKDNEHG